MTDLARYTDNGQELTATAEPAGSLREWAEEARAAAGIATSLCKTSFVPEAFRDRPEEATAAILTGRELGLSPMASLRAIYVIKGTPAMYANALRAVVQSHGHRIWVEEANDTRAIVCGRRRDSAETERVTWSIDRAKKAGLAGNQQYQKNPQAMLVARATAECARRIAADAIHGVPYAVEELDDTPPQVEQKPAKKQATRTARRAPVEPPPPSKPEEPELDEAAPAPPPATLGKDPTVDMPAGDDQPPGAITAPQLRMLQASYKAAGIADRAARLAHASGVIGRDITSANDLTKTEASTLIDELAVLVPDDEGPPDDTG